MKVACTVLNGESGSNAADLHNRKEFGKWLMDIAKYMATALLLSSAFGDMENPLVVISVIIATASTLVFGLVLVKDKKEKKGD